MAAASRNLTGHMCRVLPLCRLRPGSPSGGCGRVVPLCTRRAPLPDTCRERTAPQQGQNYSLSSLLTSKFQVSVFEVTLPSTMTFLGAVMRTFTRGSSFYSITQEGMRRGLFVKQIRPRAPCRTLGLSHGLWKEETQSHLPQELDLDGWKTMMKSDSPEDAGEKISERKDDSLTDMRELVEMWRLSGKMVPQSISEEQLKILVELATKSSRKKYLKHLAIKEGHKKLKIQKKERLKEARKEEPEKFTDHEEGSDLRNNFFLQFWHKSMDNMQNATAARSMIFGQPLVFDMAYSNYMSRRELENTVNQLMESEGWNRRSPDPFHIHFCNLQNNGPYHKEFINRYQDAWDRLFLTSTEKSYVDVFPANQLVYLTADSPNEMKKFEHDKIYIIGSLVDRSQQTGLSLAHAKRFKLATLRLPLERYLQWEIGAKNLTLDQMIRILLTLKDTGDWKEAMAFVPKRKHDGFLDVAKYKEKLDHIRKKRAYEFGTSNEKVLKLQSNNITCKPTHKKWWEDDDH